MRIGRVLREAPTPEPSGARRSPCADRRIFLRSAPGPALPLPALRVILSEAPTPDPPERTAARAPIEGSLSEARRNLP